MMKLKVLPPTLRKNNRYLALDIKVKSVISKDDLVNIVWNGCIRFFGENGTGNFSLWVMSLKKPMSILIIRQFFAAKESMLMR